MTEADRGMTALLLPLRVEPEGRWTYAVINREDATIARCRSRADADDLTLSANSYDAHRALIEELCGACQLALSALAPFSHDPAEKSGINLLRAAIAKARALTGGK